MDKCCGNCKYFQPPDKLPEDMVLRAKYKVAHPEATCQGDGKPRQPDDRPCLIWTARKGESDAG